MRTKPLFPALALALALAGGAALRGAAVSQNSGPGDFWTGEWEYYTTGVQFSRGCFRLMPGAFPGAHRLPLFPAFHAAVNRLGGDRIAAQKAQAALDAAVIAGVFLIGTLLAGPGWGAAGALAYAFDPRLASAASRPGIEAFYGFLLTAFALALLRWSRAPGDSGRAAAAGGLLGLSLLARSSLAAFPLLAALEMFRRGAPRKSLSLFLILSWLPLAPWAARNTRMFGRPMILEAGPSAAMNFWAATVGWVEAPSDMTLMNRTEHAGWLAENHALPETRRRAEAFKAGLENLRRSPGRYLRTAPARMITLWKEQGPWILPALFLFLDPKAAAAARPLLLLFAYFCVHALMAVVPRYALPMSGSLHALAAAGACALAERLRGKAGGADVDESPAEPWNRVFLRGASAAGAFLFLYSVLLLGREAGNFPNGAGAVPPEYSSRPEDYARLSALNAEAVRLAQLGEVPAARAALDRVLKEEPSFWESRLSRAMILERLGDRDGAERDGRALLDLVENAPDLRPGGEESPGR